MVNIITLNEMIITVVLKIILVLSSKIGTTKDCELKLKRVHSIIIERFWL